MPTATSKNAFQDCQPMNPIIMTIKKIGSSVKQLSSNSSGVIISTDRLHEDFLMDSKVKKLSQLF
jgi:hypothetical protein